MAGRAPAVGYTCNIIMRADYVVDLGTAVDVEELPDGFCVARVEGEQMQARRVALLDVVGAPQGGWDGSAPARLRGVGDGRCFHG